VAFRIVIAASNFRRRGEATVVGSALVAFRSEDHDFARRKMFFFLLLLVLHVVLE